MNAMTQDNLRSSFGGESQAHMRYNIWGPVATKEGFPNVGRLFAATAAADRRFRGIPNRGPPVGGALATVTESG